MDLEEHTLEESLERRCVVCGAQLTDAEIEAARDAGGPFLCLVHADEQVPLDEEDPDAG
jgi:hypothetical protein